MEKPKRRFGDRYDGYLIRNCDPLFQLIPCIMRTRTDAMVYFDYDLDITGLEKFVRLHRATDIPNLRMLHIFMAAMVRVISQMPHLNRFVSGKKIYARNEIRIAMTAKRSLTLDGEENNIMPEFEPEDTLYDVVEKVEKALEEEIFTTGEGSADGSYAVASVLGAIPTGIKSGFVNLMRGLDQIGKMPKLIHRASPFHASMYITDLGSCGIGPVFHHLYEFGTCSCFVAMGKKETRYVVNAKGEVETRRYIGVKIVVDERVCDGFYYAYAMKTMTRLIRHPERLLTPPEQVMPDDGIHKPKKPRRKKLAAQAAEAAPKGEAEREPVAAQ